MTPGRVSGPTPDAPPAHALPAARLAGHHVPPDFPAPVRGLAAVSRALAWIEGAGLAACLVTLVALALYEFVTRNLRLHGLVALSPSPPWIDGVLRHSVFLLGFLGAAYATFAARHIRIDAVTRLLPPRGRLAARVLTSLAAGALCAALAKAGLDFYQVCLQETGEVATEGQLFTSARGALVIVGGVTLVGFHFLVQAAIDGVYLFSGRTPPRVT